MRNLILVCLFALVSFDLNALSLYMNEKQSCDPEALLLQIFGESAKPMRRIEVTGDELHLFSDSVALTAVASTYTDPEQPSVKIIRDENGEIVGRIKTEVFVAALGRSGYTKFSLVSESGEVIGSIGQQLWANRTDIRSADNTAIWFKATPQKDGIWQVEIDESQRGKEVPLFFLFAWYRNQSLTMCSFNSVFNGFVANLPYIAPFVFAAVGFTYMGWWWTHKKPECPIKFPSIV